MKTAVKNARVKELRSKSGGMAYTAGFAAYKQWIKDLREYSAYVESWPERYPDSQADELRHETTLGNAWIYESLVDARKSARNYLRSIKSEFGEKAGEHLEAAAEAYGKLVDELARKSSAVSYPWDFKDIEKDWTQDMRDAQADALEKALLLEQVAIGEIEQALEHI